MARSGVTFSDVDGAARYLQGMSKNITVDAVRERLGTGSRTTLTEHLKRWRSMQVDGEGKLPQPLLELISGLWEALQAQAEKRIQEQRVVFNQEITELKTQLQAAAQTENQSKQKLHQLQETVDTEQRLKLALEKELRLTEKARDKLDILHQAAVKQSENAKNENKRLHQLTEQIQTNLEHYQQAVQQQQLAQNLEKEEQQATYAQELSRLNALLQEAETYKKTLTENQFKLEQAQLDHKKLAQSYKQLIIKLQTIEPLMIQLQLTEKNQQQQIEKIQQELLIEHQSAQTLNQQAAVLANNLQRAQKDLSQAEDKIAILRQEKMFLVQEKAQLDGAFKQMQLMTKTV
jgi:hypothetical protein